jgi:hypothetical protein
MISTQAWPRAQSCLRNSNKTRPQASSWSRVFPLLSRLGQHGVLLAVKRGLMRGQQWLCVKIQWQLGAWRLHHVNLHTSMYLP